MTPFNYIMKICVQTESTLYIGHEFIGFRQIQVDDWSSSPWFYKRY